MPLKASILLRTRIVFTVAVLLAGFVLSKILYIQYGLGDTQQRLPEVHMQRYITIEANRGNIYAEDGSLLATSLPYYKIAMDPTLPSDYLLKESLDPLCQRLADFFQENSADHYKKEILAARKAGKRYLPLIKKEISYTIKKKIMHWPLLREGRLVGGVILDKVSRRFRPFATIGLRTIGYLDKKQRGIVGLEHSFDGVLGGENGRVLIERSVGGRWHPLYDGSEIHPRQGADLMTTLDINIQEVVHNTLLRALYNHDADYGTVVVMEVKTGEVKAMANFSRQKEDNFVSDYNYAVGSQGVVEPGSTFKLATMLALLERSSLELGDSVQTGDGSFSVHNSLMRDDKKGGWGMLSAQEAFEVSSNIGISRLTMQHFGEQPGLYTDYLREKLHLHEPLGFQIKGEGKPYVKTPAEKNWSGTSLAWMSHGYELKISPLQLLTLYNAVANRGRMVAPLLVHSIQKEGKVVERFRARVIEERIASLENVAHIQTLLEGVVLEGTAKNIRSNYYRIAGKTGTVKKYQAGRYVDRYQASFVGYFPVDAPQYSCIVVVDNPRRGSMYGADVAAPVFRRIADRICRRGLQLSAEHEATDLPRIGGGWSADIELMCQRLGLSYFPMAQPHWVRTVNAGGKVAFRKATATDKVPDLRGMTLRDALYLAENAGLRTFHKGNGIRVAQQYPAPGEQLQKWNRMTLTLR